METIIPRKLVHSGKKRAYPSAFVWDCLKCGIWNLYQTKRLFGTAAVCCKACKEQFKLDKSKPLVEITRTKDMKSIID